MLKVDLSFCKMTIQRYSTINWISGEIKWVILQGIQRFCDNREANETKEA